MGLSGLLPNVRPVIHVPLHLRDGCLHFLCQEQWRLVTKGDHTWETTNGGRLTAENSGNCVQTPPREHGNSRRCSHAVQGCCPSGAKALNPPPQNGGPWSVSVTQVQNVNHQKCHEFGGCVRTAAASTEAGERIKGLPWDSSPGEGAESTEMTRKVGE